MFGSDTDLTRHIFGFHEEIYSGSFAGQVCPLGEELQIRSIKEARFQNHNISGHTGLSELLKDGLEVMICKAVPSRRSNTNMFCFILPPRLPGINK